jgi:1,4-dihydroxy-2-naphthoate octaprenyltransferase
VNTDQEQVTFEIIPKNPGIKFKYLFQALKSRNLYLSLIPIFLVLVKNLLDETLEDEILASLSCLAVVLVQLGVELANDIRDHIRGLDRVHPRSGNIAIVKGWLSAIELKRISWSLLIVGALLGLPSVLIFPNMFITILPLVAFASFAVLSDRMGMKYRAWSEWVVFLMFGPLLTVGYQMSFGGGFDLEVVFLGFITGWLAVFQIHLKNFLQIMVNTQAGFKSTVVRLGFDRAKKFLVLWWMAFVVGSVAYHSVYSAVEWLWIDAVLLVLVSIPVISSVTKLQASLGSKTEHAVFVATRASYFALALWLLENVWTVLQLEGLR